MTDTIILYHLNWHLVGCCNFYILFDNSTFFNVRFRSDFLMMWLESAIRLVKNTIPTGYCKPFTITNWGYSWLVVIVVFSILSSLGLTQLSSIYTFIFIGQTNLIDKLIRESLNDYKLCKHFRYLFIFLNPSINAYYTFHIISYPFLFVLSDQF